MKSKKGEEEIKPGNFWKKQPVAQSKQELAEAVVEKPIDEIKTVESIRKEPYDLPAGFSWYEVDIDNPDELEAVYCLLRDHYVEDDDNMFRFDYSKEFLKWALKPPGWLKSWHLAVRSNVGKKPFCAFITAIPATISVQHQEHKMVEINFLCVHSKIRKHRLAPVLISEITRRVNVTGIFQAVYTAGVTLPTPFASCQYYHRSLNPKKLIDVKFSYLKKNMTLARTIKLYKLPETTTTPGLRPLRLEDCPQACALLNNYLKNFKLYMHFDLADFEHWFSMRDGVMECYVVEDPQTHLITDMASFYSLPSSILNHPKHQTLNAAYSWYIASTKTPLPQLMKDILILAYKKGFDVFNCLEIHDNKNFLEELKFGPGDGHLKYYLYNWLTKPMEPNEVGLVLL
jgi:glycylpeptide N-tetradecanoyltransferase